MSPQPPPLPRTIKHHVSHIVRTRFELPVPIVQDTFFVDFENGYSLSSIMHKNTQHRTSLITEMVY